jgi:dTDP-4-dehydrorhamnose reductase
VVNILVVGATGMLGLEVYRAAVDAGHRTLGLGHSELDITCKTAVAAELKAVPQDVVINCAGLTKHVDGSPDDYRHANTYGPLLLARECDRIGARFIHVSTDCVFSGDRPIEDGPYTEADTPDATDIYGASKAAGEVTAAPHLTVRCSFVGNGERGLIAWLREQRESVDGWIRSYWSGSTAPAIARALVELAQSDATGIMHLTRGLVITKFDLISEICNALDLDLSIYGKWDPMINRALATMRDDVPALPPLGDALRELAGG